MISLAIGGVAWANAPTERAGGAPSSEEGAIDPKADAALHKMSDYLTGLKSLQVETTTVDEKFTKEGHKIQELQDSRIVMQRPGELRVDRTGPLGHTTFRDDGKQFSIFNQERNVFATAPAPPKLDAAIDEARERLRLDTPGGDLLMSDPYHSLTEGMSEVRYIGREPIGGVMAHHIWANKKGTSWQLWIKDGPDAMPLRYVVTSEDLPGHPQFTLELRNFQPDAPVAADSFTFTPPAGAKRVAFAPPKKAER
jgi:hypothetical protein